MASAPANGAATAAAGDNSNGTTEPPEGAPREEEPQSPTEAAAAGASDASPPQTPGPAEEKWEEVWRPRRKGRAFDRPEREKRPHHSRHKDGVHGPQGHQGVQGPAPDAVRREGKGPLQAPRSPPQGSPPPRRAASAITTGRAVHAEARLRSRFPVCGAQLAQGGPGKAQPGLTWANDRQTRMSCSRDPKARQVALVRARHQIAHPGGTAGPRRQSAGQSGKGGQAQPHDTGGRRLDNCRPWQRRGAQGPGAGGAQRAAAGGAPAL